MTFYCSVILPRGQTFTLCQHTINGLISFGGFFLCCSLNNLFLCLLCFHVRHHFLFLFSGLITTTQHELIMFQLAFIDWFWFCFAWNKPNRIALCICGTCMDTKCQCFAFFKVSYISNECLLLFLIFHCFLFVKHCNFCGFESTLCGNCVYQWEVL